MICVILPAAGVGKRFVENSGEPGRNKLELDLTGRPVFLRAVELFVGRKDVGQVILAVNPDTISEFKFRWGDKLSFHGVKVVAGGRVERWETVLRALDEVDESCDRVAIHDAARPLASSGLIDRVFEASARYSAVIPASPVSATLKRVVVDPHQPAPEVDPLDALLGGPTSPATAPAPKPVRIVAQTLDRRDVFEVQTPQVFDKALLRRAYAQITDGKISGGGITDDAGLVEALADEAHPVRVVDGEGTNIKITRPDDMALAAAIFQAVFAEQHKDLAKKRLFTDEDNE